MMKASAPFETAVRHNRHIYRLDKFKEELQNRKKTVKLTNASVMPDVNKDYFCLTCGSKDGKCHPVTSFCFHCDTDNWQSVN